MQRVKLNCVLVQYKTPVKDILKQLEKFKSKLGIRYYNIMTFLSYDYNYHGHEGECMLKYLVVKCYYVYI